MGFKLGYIGFGEAAYNMGKGLKKEGFEDICAEVMGKRQRERLRRLIGFSFERHPKLNWPDERLRATERHLQKRVRQLLNLEPVRKRGKNAGKER